MTRPVDPVGSIGGPDRIAGGEDRRRAPRRQADRRALDASRAPALSGDTPPEPAAHAPGPAGDASVFAAQMLGQGGQKRGLKGGAEVLDAARSTYLGAQYSGADDRRPKPGRARDDDV